jgi:hypothetical protein
MNANWRRRPNKATSARSKDFAAFLGRSPGTASFEEVPGRPRLQPQPSASCAIRAEPITPRPGAKGTMAADVAQRHGLDWLSHGSTAGSSRVLDRGSRRRDRKLAQMLHTSKRFGASHIRGSGHEVAFVVRLRFRRWRGDSRSTYPVFWGGIKSEQGTTSTVLTLSHTTRRRWARTIPGPCRSTQEEADSPIVGSYWTLTAFV